MRCKYVENFDNLIIFFNNNFDECDLEVVINSNSIACTSLIFLDEISATKLEKIIESYEFKSPINVYFCCCANRTDLELAYRLKKSDIIKSITVSTSDIYNSLDFPNTNIGIEGWEYDDKALFLRPIYNFSTIDDLLPLLNAVNKIVDEILSYSPKNDLEKIILVDYWMQKNIQYISSRESNCEGLIYICNDIDQNAKASDVILNNYGNCEGISLTAALILNHPKISVQCRQVGSEKLGHAWNIVRCDEKDYYFDFTHNITRNPNKMDSALKAKKYTNKFSLIGINDAKEKYGICYEYDTSHFSNASYPRNEIDTFLNKTFNSSNPSFEIKLVKQSYIAGDAHGN